MSLKSKVPRSSRRPDQSEQTDSLKGANPNEEHRRLHETIKRLTLAVIGSSDKQVPFGWFTLTDLEEPTPFDSSSGRNPLGAQRFPLLAQSSGCGELLHQPRREHSNGPSIESIEPGTSKFDSIYIVALAFASSLGDHRLMDTSCCISFAPSRRAMQQQDDLFNFCEARPERPPPKNDWIKVFRWVKRARLK